MRIKIENLLNEIDELIIELRKIIKESIILGDRNLVYDFENCFSELRRKLKILKDNNEKI